MLSALPAPLATVDLLAQHAPPGSTREHRIALLLATGEALQAGKPVPPAGGRLLGDAVVDWLRYGGKLEQRLRVGRRGDHDNVPKIVARLTVEAADRPQPGLDTLVLTIPSSTMSDSLEDSGET